MFILCECSSMHKILTQYKLTLLESGIKEIDGYFEHCLNLGERPLEPHIRITKNKKIFKLSGIVNDGITGESLTHIKLFLVSENHSIYKIEESLEVNFLDSSDCFESIFQWDFQSKSPVVVIDAVGYQGAAYIIRMCEKP